MKYVIRTFGSAALLAVLTGCGNDFNKEVERWNRQFAAYKSSCLSGNVESCRLACEMTEKKSLCESARRIVDPDNPAQVQWLQACPQSIAAQGAPLCQRATPTAQAQAPTVTAPVLAAPEPATPQASAPHGGGTPAQAVAQMQKSANIRIRSGASQVKGALSKEVVRRIVHRHINEVKFCYSQGLASNPDLSGRVAIKFVISGTGAVQMSAVASSTLSDPSVENCIAQAVRRWTFPQPKGGGIVTVTYPYLLSTSN